MLKLSSFEWICSCCALLLVTSFIRAVSTDGSVYEKLDIIGEVDSFKYIVKPRTKECFYTILDTDSRLVVSFQVLNGKNNVINMLLTGPLDTVIERKQLVNKASTENVAQFPDNSSYSVCFDNSFSSRTNKHLDIFIGSWKPVDWVNYNEEFTAFDIAANASEMFLDSLFMLGHHIQRSAMLHRRWSEIDQRDMEATMSRVDMTAMVTSLIIILTSVCQILFVRHIFHTQTGKV